MRDAVLSLGLLVAFALVGCGPLSRPLPQRLDDDNQKQIDDAWNKALNPPEKHDRQAWLDAMIASHAYQVGVDEMQFRSVKKWSGGTVVMEAHFDRAKPNDDHFAITVLDAAGKSLRTERYTRENVDQAARDLEDPHLPADDPRMQAYQARVAAVEAMLPKPKEDPAKK